MSNIHDIPCPPISWIPLISWTILLKIAKIFKNIRFTPLEIRDIITDISD